MYLWPRISVYGRYGKQPIKKAKDLGTDIDNPNDILRGLDQLIADNKSIRLGVKAGKQTVGVDELKTFRGMV